MAELADALASGASPRKGVEVQVLLSAPEKQMDQNKHDRLLFSLFIFILEPVQYLFMCGFSSIILSFTRKKSAGILTYGKDFRRS